MVRKFLDENFELFLDFPKFQFLIFDFDTQNGINLHYWGQIHNVGKILQDGGSIKQFVEGRKSPRI